MQLAVTLAVVVASLATAGAAVRVSEVDDELSLSLPQDPAVAAVLLEAEDRREPTAALLALTESPEPALRGRAVLALGRVGRPSQLPRLVDLLRDPEPPVRAAAAFALGRTQFDLVPAFAAALRTRAAERLAPLLADAPAVARQAAWALGQTGAARAELDDWLRSAATAVGDSAPDERVLAAAIEAWWRQPDVGVDPLRPFIGAASTAVRLAVAHALRRLDDPNAWPLLLPMLDDGSADVRLMAIKGLQPAPESIAVEHGVRFLRDRDWRAQCEAANWLGRAWRQQDQPPAADAFEAVLRRSLDRRLHVRRCALRALGAVGRDRAVAVDRLLEAVTEEEEAVRAAALAALVEVGGGALEEAVRRLRERAAIPADPGDADRSVLLAYLREHMLEAEALVAALAETQRREDQLWLEAMLLEGPERIRAAAFERVAELDPAGAWRLAQAWLVQDSLLLRAAAARVMTRLVRDRAVSLDEEERIRVGERLWRQYFDGSGPQAAAVRSAALEALAVLDRPLLVARFSLLLEEPDRTLRAQAIALLGGEPEILSRLQRTDEGELLRHEGGRTADDYVQLAVRAIELQSRPPVAEIATPRGTVAVRLRADQAPLTVIQVVELIRSGFYDGSPFHRVIAGFVAQGGGRPEPPWAAPALRSEDSPIDYGTGAVGLALAGRDTGSSQFFVTQAPQPHLTGRYPLFGQIVEGQRVADRIQPGDRMTITIRD